MPKSVPASFDPFATHSFTNNNVLSNQGFQTSPSRYPLPIPSSQTQKSSLDSSAQKSSGVIKSPQPKHATDPTRSSWIDSNNNKTATPPASSLKSTPQKKTNDGAIFVTFQQDRSSPELEEILLRKQLAHALGPTALGLDKQVHM